MPRPGSALRPAAPPADWSALGLQLSRGLLRVDSLPQWAELCCATLALAPGVGLVWLARLPGPEPGAMDDVEIMASHRGIDGGDADRGGDELELLALVTALVGRQLATPSAQPLDLAKAQPELAGPDPGSRYLSLLTLATDTGIGSDGRWLLGLQATTPDCLVGAQAELAAMAADMASCAQRLEADLRGLLQGARIRYLAHYDAITGLPNRNRLEEQLTALLLATPERCVPVIVIQLGRLAQMARTLDRSVLELVLREVARRLDQLTAAGDLLARIDSDAMALVLAQTPDTAAALAFAQELQAELTQAYCAEHHEIYLDVAIGISVAPAHGHHGFALLKLAAMAAEYAARTEAHTPLLYTQAMEADAELRLALEAELHRALERDEFELHYQPQLNLHTGQVVGVEALLRWHHPQRGLVAPALFIPALEAGHMMAAVGTWVLRAACQQAAAWQTAGLPPVRMAVNLSAQQFRAPGLVETVQQALQSSGLAPDWLELELTESLVLESAETVISMMHALKALGLSLSLDDFGTGYSSLSYLRRFPVDRIKVDQSFVRHIADDAGSAILARTILVMAQNLGLATIAEGVELDTQLGYLRQHHCDEMQGFLFSRALPAHELAALLAQDRRLPLVAGNSGAVTVLVVDDDAGVSAALKRLLRRDGLTVLLATSAEAGLRQLALHDVGLVLSDQRMPGMTGTEFLFRVKSLYPDTQRIMLTGYTDLESVLNAVNRGALSKVLCKPWNDEDLREVVREALRHYQLAHGQRHRLRQLDGPSRT